jgi:hypothetical protein
MKDQWAGHRRASRDALSTSVSAELSSHLNDLRAEVDAPEAPAETTDLLVIRETWATCSSGERLGAFPVLVDLASVSFCPCP